MAEKKPKKKMSPNSLKALEATQFNNLSPERRREIARMGAEATNKKIRKRKSFREIIETLGVTDATDLEKEKFRQMFPGADPDEITKDVMLVASLYNQGIAPYHQQQTQIHQLVLDHLGKSLPMEQTHVERV